jgi:catechol 2,3-dioxygenase-like lactoylglutathione lyase family enzyme
VNFSYQLVAGESLRDGGHGQRRPAGRPGARHPRVDLDRVQIAVAYRAAWQVGTARRTDRQRLPMCPQPGGATVDRRGTTTEDEEPHPMLGDHPIYPVLLATDLAAAREFYHDRIGLEILTEGEAEIVFRCGGTQLAVTRSTTGTADEQTQASWYVTDVRAEVAELRSRGVKVEEYDMPGLKTEDGIADIGFAWIAWIVDPGKNALGILQVKQ